MIKTVEQYLDSLNDGREVWCLGERVADVRTHPTVSTIIRTAAMDYVLPNHPDYRDLFVTQDEDGEDINFLLTSPQTPEDLLRRRECYTVGIRSGANNFGSSPEVPAPGRARRPARPIHRQQQDVRLQ